MVIAPGKDAPVIAAIGNFDGVHLGHQFLIAETAALARAEGAAPGAVVFDPHSRRFFRPDDPPFLLTTPEMRNALLRECGVEQVYTLEFDAALAAKSPREFVFEILKKRLRLKAVVTGAEFQFGKGRAGDAEALSRLCAEAGMAAHQIEPRSPAPGHEKFGSSGVRQALREGDVKSAASMLGRPWSVSGAVLAGRKLGRTIGFPTANLVLGEQIEPLHGVYAIRVGVASRTFDGVANFGRRPTVGATSPLLEAHLFDFDGDLYGQAIEIAFVDFIRTETKFDGIEALKAQIKIDCAAAKAKLADH